MLAGLLLLLRIASPAPALALIFVSDQFQPSEPVPPDFPYWENVTQRRYEGPSVIYLGAGWAITARHVGMGEILLEGGIYMPVIRSRHTLMNLTGSGADAMIFELDPSANIPDLPIVPIATSPPTPGEEVLVIGFGRERAKVVVWYLDGEPRFGFEWSQKGVKHWGTNRVVAVGEVLAHDGLRTHTFAFRFDEPDSPDTTPYEAQAATGDSGGGVFVKRDGQWQLVGMMVSVSSQPESPHRSAAYGDLTYAADVSFYRSEILRWARPRCSNEQDDDGDGKIDFPADPGCESPLDLDERDPRTISPRDEWALGLVLVIGVGVGGGWGWAWRRRQRGTSTPDSTRPSSAD